MKNLNFQVTNMLRIEMVKIGSKTLGENALWLKLKQLGNQEKRANGLWLKVVRAWEGQTYLNGLDMSGGVECEPRAI